MGSNEYTPDEVSPPGETLLDLLEERGMTQAELAARTDRSPKTILGIIEGRIPITLDTAVQLERALGVPAHFWNNRERQYREFLGRHGNRRGPASRTKPPENVAP